VSLYFSLVTLISGQCQRPPKFHPPPAMAGNSRHCGEPITSKFNPHVRCLPQCRPSKDSFRSQTGA
jgi:hypothetical protein